MIRLTRLGLAYYALLTSLFVYGTLGAALVNVTLPLPAGTTNNGTPGLLCTPTKWTDVASFYLFNYIAHAATVITRPGEKSIDFAVTVVGSLLFPAVGLHRGIEAILCGAVFRKRDRDDADLIKAAKSGALCMVVRTLEWRPKDGEAYSNGVIRRGKGLVDAAGRRVSMDDASLHLITYQAPWTFSRFGRPVYVHRQTVHGAYALPPGYRFLIVPSDARFAPMSTTQTIEVASTYNVVKALVAITQTGYACLTLYRSRGDQIEQFGYAAFGLTVAPYAVMSVMNLIGNLCRPDYASLYMVESSIMDEARGRGGAFYGTVGRVEEETNTGVCSYSTAAADDVDELRLFKVVDGQVTVKLGTPVAGQYAGSSSLKDEKSISECSISLTHDWRLKEPPENMNFAGTENDALLLFPSANPLKLSDDHFPELADSRLKISNLELRKLPRLFNWKCRIRHWKVTFSPHPYINPHPFRWRFAKFFLTTVISFIPVLINGVMSHFKTGTIPPSQSSTWMSYTMQWMLVGVFTGVWFVLDQEAKDASPSPKYYFGPVGRIAAYVFSASPAVGGFVVVGQMLTLYGVCVWVGS